MKTFKWGREGRIRKKKSLLSDESFLNGEVLYVKLQIDYYKYFLKIVFMLDLIK